MSNPEVARPESPAPATAVASSGALAWLLGQGELARAEAGARGLDHEQRECLRRAKLAFEMGEVARAPGNVVRAGSPAAIATNLFRQASYWALLSQREAASQVPPSEAWGGAEPALLEVLSLSESERARVATIMSSSFVELAEGAAEEQTANEELMRRVARQLVGHVQAPVWRLEWVKLKRVARLGILGVLVVAALVVCLAVALRKPDLAAGKPWHTSSVGIVCHPEKSDCGGTATAILFHTKLEQEPWFEYDLGAPTTFSSLTVENRHDFGQDRAVPLVAEVSDDDQIFRQIAQRDEVFDTWRPSFPPTRARYLRLRVTRESILHLEAVRVHP